MAMSLSCFDLLTWACDLFAPTRCCGCGNPGILLCAGCTAAFAAAPLIVRAARAGAPPIASLGSYEGRLRDAVLALKFRGAQSVGVRLGRLLAPKLLWPIELVIPVPLHAGRMRERGYNQAVGIASGVAATLKCPLVTDALVRRR